jgi:hypothetical protein
LVLSLDAECGFVTLLMVKFFASLHFSGYNHVFAAVKGNEKKL